MRPNPSPRFLPHGRDDTRAHPRAGKVRVRMIHYLQPGDRLMFPEYLGHWGRDLAGSKVDILHYESLFDRSEYEPGTYLFSTFDDVVEPMKRFIDELALRLRGQPGIRILNDPQRVLQRFDLHTALWHQGRSQFRSARATQDTSVLRFPVFVRSEGSHDGALSPLIHTSDEIETWIGRALALGRPLRDLLVVEFCDTRDAGGWYRKYSAFCVGGRIVPRRMDSGRTWMLKFAGNEFLRQHAEEELDYVRASPHEQELQEIFAIARTDYGRIDYSMKDGRVQPWEINLNPTVGRGDRPSRHTAQPPEVRAIRTKAKELFYAGFHEAWSVLAEASPSGAIPVTIRLDPAIVAAARVDDQRRWRTRSALIQAGVDLVKPLMKTPLRPVLRGLYRLPKWLVHANGGTLFRLLGRRARQKRAEVRDRLAEE
jgi:hypothetical protein